MFRAKLDDWSLLVDSLKTIQGLLNEVNVIVSDEGLEIVMMDQANVALVQFKLPKSKFKEYKITTDAVDGKFCFGLLLKDANKILGKLTKDATLIMEVDQEAKFKIDSKGKFKEFSMAILDLSIKPQNVPPLKFNTIMSIGVTELEDAFNDVGIVSDVCCIEVDSNRIFKITGKGDTSKSATTLMGAEFEKFDQEKVSRSKYSLEYLNYMICKKLGKDIKISLAHDYPLRLDYVSEGVTLSFILAPRVEND